MPQIVGNRGQFFEIFLGATPLNPQVVGQGDTHTIFCLNLISKTFKVYLQTFLGK